MAKGKRTQTDPRFKPIVEFYCAECARRYGMHVWDGTDGKALNALLTEQPQMPIERLIKLLEAAFQWAHSGQWCPLLPGFRFRQFASHRLAIMVKSSGISKAERKQGPTKLQVTRVIQEFRSQAGCISAAQKDAWWDRKFQIRLGISLAEADEILKGKE